MHQNGDTYTHNSACLGLAKRSALQNMREQGMRPSHVQGQMLALQYLESGTSECNCDREVKRTHFDEFIVEEHDVMEQLRKAGFQIALSDPDTDDQSSFGHPAIYGVLDMVTGGIGWGMAMEWYWHDGRFCWVLANTEPSIRMDDPEWLNRLVLAYIDCLMDRYATLPYDK
jgi:hypothetical protein